MCLLLIKPSLDLFQAEKKKERQEWKGRKSQRGKKVKKSWTNTEKPSSSFLGAPGSVSHFLQQSCCCWCWWYCCCCCRCCCSCCYCCCCFLSQQNGWENFCSFFCHETNWLRNWKRRRHWLTGDLSMPRQGMPCHAIPGHATPRHAANTNSQVGQFSLNYFFQSDTILSKKCHTGQSFLHKIKPPGFLFYRRGEKLKSAVPSDIF